MKMLRPILSVLVCCLLAGCSMGKNLSAVRFSEQGGVGTQRVEDVQVSRKKFQSALTQGAGVNDVRLVEIFRREGQPFPQYHLFDIRKGGPYELLKLEDGDILLAANDYVVYEPTGFRTYVVDYLRTQQEGSVTEG